MDEMENKEIENELSQFEELNMAEDTENVIEIKENPSEDFEELPELVFAEDLFDADETEIPDSIDTEFVDAEEDLFLGVNAALTEQIENEFGNAYAPTEEKKPSKVLKFLKDVPTWTKVLVSVILVLLLLVGFLFGTTPGRTIFSNIVVEMLFHNVNVVPNETPTPGLTGQPDVTPEISGTITSGPTITGESANPTQAPNVSPTVTLTPTPTPVPVMDSENVINILLLGEENIFGASLGRTDAILVASVNKDTGEIRLVSFLRDAYVLINHPKNGQVWDRLNAAYSAGGATLMIDTIERNFGIDIDSYVLINFEGFEALIDDLGGIKISLTPAESEYLNTTRYISNADERNTVAGLQTMSGSQVLGYCRVRKVPTSNGLTDDYGRTYRQRVVLKALFDKYKEKSLVELYMVLRKCLSYVTVPENLQTLAAECLRIVMEKGTLEFETLQMPKRGYLYDTTTPEGQEVLGFYPENINILQEFLYGETAE